MNNKKKNLLILSDYNLVPFAGYINSNQELYSANCGEYGQIFQNLINPTNGYWGIFILPSPKIINNYNFAYQWQDFSLEECLEEVNNYADLIIKKANDVDYIFVSSWTDIHLETHSGPLDWQEKGTKNLISKMNICMSEKFEDINNIFMLDANQWFYGLDEAPFSRKLWYLTKAPFTNSFYKKLYEDLNASILATYGNSKKLIVLDLDNTMWGGIVGEVGWENVKIGGHDFIGEAFRDFQMELKRLASQGIQLAICSKNDESAALKVFENNSEMVLKMSDISSYRINWTDKAQNIKEIIQELNLGTQSVVFLDDSSFERGRVKDEFPEILVPDLPNDPTGYVDLLKGIFNFRLNAMTDEDKKRTKMYVAQRKRNEIKNKISSTEDWLKTLDTEVGIQRFSDNNSVRVTQLFNKTNQLNLTTRRLTDNQISEIASSKNSDVFVFDVFDKYGQLGVCGILGLEYIDKVCMISDFILSCRVMGRGVEETMLSQAFIEAKKRNLESVDAIYLPTKKNRPTLDVFEKNKFKILREHHFQLLTKKPIKKPIYVNIKDIT